MEACLQKQMISPHPCFPVENWLSEHKVEKRNKVEERHKKFIVGKAKSVQGKSDKNWTATYTDETNRTW